MWCLLLMFLYTWFMEKLFCSNSSLVTEPWGAELVFFGWSQHRSPSLSVFSEKNLRPYVSYNSHISIDLTPIAFLLWWNGLTGTHTGRCYMEALQPHVWERNAEAFGGSFESAGSNQVLQVNSGKQPGKSEVLVIFFCYPGMWQLLL